MQRVDFSRIGWGVKGDLTLGSSLNVTVPSGGSLDPGIYKVISYDGELINNGLSLGTAPSGTF